MSQDTEAWPTYGVGTKAFMDTFAGLIPCTVVEIHVPKARGWVCGRQEELTVQVDEDGHGYAKGELLKRSAFFTPPRVHRRTGILYRINTGYVYGQE